MKPKTTILSAVFAALATAAIAYGPKGHTVVGEIADLELANHKAGVEVKKLLGGNLDLGTVATWADDIKSGDIDDSDMNDFLHAHRKKLGTEVEHKAFHFTDIPFQETAYSDKSIGAKPYDLVHAINDCIFILQHQKTGERPSDGYFDDVPPRVALILLAHYVGDLHQPLHVGSGYITEDLEFVDPDKKKGAQAEADQGGNLLKFQSGELHAYWDTGAVVKAMNAAHVSKTDQLSAYAKFLFDKGGPTTTSGDPITWPAKWATEILPKAAEAHDVTVVGTAEIKVRGRTIDGWAISPTDGTSWKDYETNAASTVEDEIRKGGFRLAQILEKIWPD